MRAIDVRNSLEQARAALTAHPEKALSHSGPYTARWLGGLRCEVRGANAPPIYTDMPVTFGGDAGAPSPGWYLRAALVACTATVIAMRAATLAMTLTVLEVSVESESDQRGLLGLDDRISAGVSRLRMRVRIGADGVDGGELRTLVAWSDAHSPVACTLRNAPACPIDVEIVPPGG